MGIVQNFSGLMAARFFLAVGEVCLISDKVYQAVLGTLISANRLVSSPLRLTCLPYGTRDMRSKSAWAFSTPSELCLVQYQAFWRT